MAINTEAWLGFFPGKRRRMKRQLLHELVVAVSAEKVWEIYGTLRLPKFLVEMGICEKFVVLEGDGGVGTVIWFQFPSGTRGPSSFKKRYSVIDNDRLVKEAEVINEGGYLQMGFRKFINRFEIEDKGDGSSLIRSIVEYEIDDDHNINESFISIRPFTIVAEAIGKHLSGNKSE